MTSTWSLATNRLRLTSCAWSRATESLRMTACAWSRATNRLRLIAWVWSPASDRLRLTACVCPQAGLAVACSSSATAESASLSITPVMASLSARTRVTRGRPYSALYTVGISHTAACSWWVPALYSPLQPVGTCPIVPCCDGYRPNSTLQSVL